MKLALRKKFNLYLVSWFVCDFSLFGWYAIPPISCSLIKLLKLCLEKLDIHLQQTVEES